MELLNLGDKNRSTAFTNMNAHSSRSHAVYMVKIERRRKYTEKDIDSGNIDKSMVQSILNLVDLAGSERIKKTQATGSRLSEAKNINLALLALGNCIQALSDKNRFKHVPFRDSKLTRLLEDSLGGNCKTSLVITIGPSAEHTGETLSTLMFGLRAMKIENYAEINKKVDWKARCAQLQAEIDRLNDEKSNWILGS
jgi:kinesin family protein 5